jgi:preprotein translocase subunit SecB
VGRAYFHVSDELEESEVARYILFNGSAILLGLLRAQVSQVTALGRWGTFLLPPVDIVQALANSAGDTEEEDA